MCDISFDELKQECKYDNHETERTKKDVWFRKFIIITGVILLGIGVFWLLKELNVLVECKMCGDIKIRFLEENDLSKYMCDDCYMQWFGRLLK